MDDTSNADVAVAWNTVLFEKFSRYRYVLTTGLASHGEEALRRHPLRAGARVLDIGSGFGDATQRIAGLVGARGEAVGVDVSANFIAVSREDAAQAGVHNARFLVRDVQTEDLEGPYERAFSRFGTMFFASPVAALRNVRRALTPDGELTMVVWRRREDNLWLYAAEQPVRAIVPLVEESDQLTCGPGPFSMAGADLVSDQLRAAGFSYVAFERFDDEICIGRDMDEALGFAMTIGPAGEMLRLLGPASEQYRAAVRAAVLEVLSGFAGERGVFAPASTWIISARAE